ncbi:hypothetical protein G5V59_15660 [Nocardioides sp. W3-2-3]|uniref:DUF7507 domain-containing protein n=1 Tax=Nocardioides convexus TaxID=2712224 RepID=UPI0024185676|nr:hypothetical protein [Nocardioides convexus]NHA00870.1 hypothetical protein [Nocardioides convexus]
MRFGGSSRLTNEGTVTLTGLAVSDPLAGAVTCSPSTVAPGDSVVCSADNAYVITQADVEAGSVDNIATAKGEGPKGDPDDPSDDVPSNPDTTTTPVEQVAKAEPRQEGRLGDRCQRQRSHRPG